MRIWDYISEEAVGIDEVVAIRLYAKAIDFVHRDEHCPDWILQRQDEIHRQYKWGKYRLEE